ncbi:hypothetical protein Pfo_027421 [Paulownia fortunei]|nr:hypothetical protein Pfo_027421 [Paulownia fortunei]
MDKSRDESKREQMIIVLRFVDKQGFIRERFFDVVHVKDTKASTLKREISSILSCNNLIIQNIRGQGYNDASTMRGQWNGLQALFLNECPYAYFVHCFTHRLQLTLLETGKGKNQIGIVQHPGDIRWGSHLRSLFSLLNMFDLFFFSLSTKASGDGTYDIMISFEFVFILYFMVELQKMTDNFLKIFCEKHEIDVLDMNGPCRTGRGRLHKTNHITLEHHYRINIFTGTIYSILQEVSYRFDKNAVEFPKLSSGLDPRDGYKSFNINNICKLFEKFYPSDFTSKEKLHIKYQLKLFELDIRCNIHSQNVSTLSELCQVLSKIGKTMNYYLVNRLIKLILTLPVSTAITERVFSYMKFVKTRLRNKMEDDILATIY